MASLFVRVIRDHPINLVTRKETQQLRQVVLKLPSWIDQLSVTSLERAIADAKTAMQCLREQQSHLASGLRRLYDADI
ncbi:hypothetical protein VLF92_21125 [Pseudomonas chengduensis]